MGRKCQHGPHPWGADAGNLLVFILHIYVYTMFILNTWGADVGNLLVCIYIFIYYVYRYSYTIFSSNPRGRMLVTVVFFFSESIAVLM